jgi:hypothetical protein
VNERDLEPEEAFPRLGVDQLGAGALELGERQAQVVHLEGDVVHPRPALREELPTGVSAPSDASSSTRLSPTRSEAASTPCSRTGVAVLDSRAEESLVRVDRLVQIVDRDSQVMDAPRLH